ncbi:MAG TPA: glycosyltransferase family 2 protein [Pyrinomonadaceae bacterium]
MLTTTEPIPKPKVTAGDVEFVSVVIPCYNEERFILKALDQLSEQYDNNHYEIIIVDGMSTDKTRDLVNQFKAEHPELEVRLVDNPARNIPTALNLGVAAAQGEIIARMDAHAVPSSGYVRRCVEVLHENKQAGVVGMPCHVLPGANTLMAQAIASGVSHPFGIGDAKYRLQAGAAPQEAVDTVAFACFRKELWQDLGGFNESLLTNEDYDFNYRVRNSGRVVLLDRSGHCDYFARTTLGELATQYRRYGGWKARMVRLHPASIKLRHFVAPVFVLSLVVLTILSVLWYPFALLLGLEIGFYFAFALFCAWQVKSRTGSSLAIVLIMPWVFLTIHLTWGVSFLLGLVRQPK